MLWTAVALRIHSGRCVAHGHLSIIIPTVHSLLSEPQYTVQHLRRWYSEALHTVILGRKLVDGGELIVVTPGYPKVNANIRLGEQLWRRRFAAMLCNMLCNFNNLVEWISGMLGKARDSLF